MVPPLILVFPLTVCNMASEGEKAGGDQVQAQSSKFDLVIVLLRLLAFLSTLSATLVMALNDETKTITVATIGTVPIKATLTAKFQHTPAFVFFVMANGVGSLHSLLMLVFCFVGRKCNYKGLAPLAIPVLDMMNVAIVASGVSAAAFMGELGRNGNSHTRWNKICDKFERFCDQGGGAMAASFFGLMVMIVVCSVSIVRLRNYNSNYSSNRLLAVVP